MMTEYTPKNLLVTGGAGFIGANFIHYFLKQYPNANIINLDLLTYAGNLDHLKSLENNARYEFIHGDIADEKLVADSLRKFAIDTIVHFAAESHVDRSITGPRAFVETNVLGTFNLLEQARVYWLEEKKYTHKDCRFHHISTDEVYGTLQMGDAAFTETTAYQPNSPYSASKAGSDHLARAYFHTYQLPMTMSNCSNNYGPYQHPEKLIPTIIRCCIKGETIPIYGNGTNIRDWLYVDDHCQAIDTIIRTGELGENYNVGGKNEIANLELTETICQLFDERYPAKAPHKNLIEFVTDRPGHDFRYAIDNSKIQKELKWQPAYGFHEAINKTIDYYLKIF